MTVDISPIKKIIISTVLAPYKDYEFKSSVSNHEAMILGLGAV